MPLPQPPTALQRLAPFAATVLRVAVGVVFIAHGWQKLDNGVSGFAGFLTSLNIPAPELMAWVVTILEIGGGVLLVLGLGTRLAGLALAALMVGTIITVKAEAGLIGEQGVGAELDVLLLAGGLTLALLGPGAASLDRAIGLEPKTVTA